MNFGKRDLGLVLSETVGDADTLRFTRDERYAVESPNEKMRMAAASVAGSTHHSRAEQNPYIRRMPHLQYPILMECVIYSLLALHKSSQEDPATKLQIANVVAVALTLTRIIKSTVTGQAPVTFVVEWRNTPRTEIYPLFTASSCFCHSLTCHVLSSCSLVLNTTCSLHNILQ